MPSSQSSTENEKRRPRGDMYLRAEQRHQAEAAAARVTEILTPTVPSLYDGTPAGDAIQPPPALETLATTTSVATSGDGLVAPPPSMAGVDWSFVEPPPSELVAAAMAEGAVDARSGPAAPIADVPAAAASVAIADTVEQEVKGPAPASVATTPTREAPVTSTPIPISRTREPRVVSTTAAPVASTRRPQRRGQWQSLAPATVFGVIALAAAIGIASMFRPSRPERPVLNTASTAAGPATPAQIPTPPAQKPVVPIDGGTPPVAQQVQQTASPRPVEPPAVAQAAQRPVATQPAQRPAVTPPLRRPEVTPASAASQADRPAAVTPVHTAAEGQLRVTSTPSGARVTVNGIGWGQTPLTLAHLPLGAKTVRVTQDGYASQERLVDLRGDTASASVQFALRRAN